MKCPDQGGKDTAATGGHGDSLVSWSRWSCWTSLHLAILPFIQGCMFSLGFYLVKAKLAPWLFGTSRR